MQVRTSTAPKWTNSSRWCLLTPRFPLAAAFHAADLRSDSCMQPFPALLEGKKRQARDCGWDGMPPVMLRCPPHWSSSLTCHSIVSVRQKTCCYCWATNGMRNSWSMTDKRRYQHILRHIRRLFLISSRHEFKNSLGAVIYFPNHRKRWGLFRAISVFGCLNKDYSMFLLLLPLLSYIS